MEVSIQITKDNYGGYRFTLSDASNGMIAAIPDDDFENGLEKILDQARIFVKIVHKQTNH